MIPSGSESAQPRVSSSVARARRRSPPRPAATSSRARRPRPGQGEGPRAGGVHRLQPLQRLRRAAADHRPGVQAERHGAEPLPAGGPGPRRTGRRHAGEGDRDRRTGRGRSPPRQGQRRGAGGAARRARGRRRRRTSRSRRGTSSGTRTRQGPCQRWPATMRIPAESPPRASWRRRSTRWRMQRCSSIRRTTTTSTDSSSSPSTTRPSPRSTSSPASARPRHEVAFRLIDISTVYVNFGVPDTMIGQPAIDTAAVQRVFLGQKLPVTADAFEGRTLTGDGHQDRARGGRQDAHVPHAVDPDQPGDRAGTAAAAAGNDRRRSASAGSSIER